MKDSDPVQDELFATLSARDVTDGAGSLLAQDMFTVYLLLLLRTPTLATNKQLLKKLYTVAVAQAVLAVSYSGTPFYLLLNVVVCLAERVTFLATDSVVDADTALLFLSEQSLSVRQRVAPFLRRTALLLTALRQPYAKYCFRNLVCCYVPVLFVLL